MPKKAEPKETPVVYPTEENLHVPTEEELDALFAHLDEEGDRVGDPDAPEITETPAGVTE